MTNTPAVVVTTACLFDISASVSGVLNGAVAGFRVCAPAATTPASSTNMIVTIRTAPPARNRMTTIIRLPAPRREVMPKTRCVLLPIFRGAREYRHHPLVTGLPAPLRGTRRDDG